MDHLSVEPLVQDQKAVDTSRASHFLLILSAWLGTLLLSRLPQILLSELGLITPSDWSLWWWASMGAALFALTYAWQAIRPLRGYFLIMTMIYVVTILLSLLQQTSIWTSWFGPERSWLVRFFGDRLGIVLMGLALAVILALIGHKRSDYFLTLGNVSARAEGMRLPWTIAGPIIALVLTALTTTAILAMSSPQNVTLVRVIPLLPAILILALMNAFGEELAYRAAPLSQLWEVIGKRQAIWLTALWFGLGHYYGGISFGAMGAIFFTLVAVLFSKAMLETRGLAIPIFMHLWGDVVLYLILAPGSA
jgi:membrane protease YdiL (CAAX protease family)